MTDFQTALDEHLPLRTAGALPGTRTFGQVEEALNSADIDEVKAELVHTRAHYQALEYMLNSEERILETILAGIARDAELGEEAEVPAPQTVEEAVRLVVRLYGSVIVESAYDTAHSTGFFMGVLGMDLQTSLQNLFGDLDWSDPERELSEAELQALATPVVDTED
ncbi:hypothetical protein SEA_RONA_52 [Microbacterium phage Rona]|uniref:Uncharacterized protein n=1 Tax=Microbacterium phage Kieran TaxID=2126931 RepID=A0A2R4A2K9_9CAUD|nr:hypothetical protein PBI_KIERAN_52 [Microbacterium phage Kieran]UYL86840.1 hypothetical protein SEA_RONA_52 [Microbacterium phage Rona]